MKKSDIFNKLMEIQDLIWEEDDMLSQESLFEVQNITAKLVLNLANDLEKGSILIEKYPWLYRREI